MYIYTYTCAYIYKYILATRINLSTHTYHIAGFCEYSPGKHARIAGSTARGSIQIIKSQLATSFTILFYYTMTTALTIQNLHPTTTCTSKSCGFTFSKVICYSL